MSNFFKKLLSESGEISTARFCTIAGLFMGFIIAVYGLKEGKDIDQLAILASIFIGPTFGAKTIQKFAEVKTKKDT